jgi:hypothetical protein
MFSWMRFLGKGRSLMATVERQFQASASGDVQDLLPHLHARGEDYARDAMAKRTDRGTTETKAVRQILEAQQKHIRDTVSRHEKIGSEQRMLAFGDREDEVRQLQADGRYWDKWLIRLDQELKTEPGRIRELYQFKAKRIEPVGLVYLWPVTGQ